MTTVLRGHRFLALTHCPWVYTLSTLLQRFLGFGRRGCDNDDPFGAEHHHLFLHTLASCGSLCWLPLTSDSAERGTNCRHNEKRLGFDSPVTVLLPVLSLILCQAWISSRRISQTSLRCIYLLKCCDSCLSLDEHILVVVLQFLKVLSTFSCFVFAYPAVYWMLWLDHYGPVRHLVWFGFRYFICSSCEVSVF